MKEARMLGSCQVRSKTEGPCPHLAVVEIRGVAFCGPCAREQEAYFAIGELTQEEDETQGSRSKPLAEALERMRRERVRGTEGIAAAWGATPGQRSSAWTKKGGKLAVPLL